MSAETGVGPSIASGSHTCGTCADFAGAREDENAANAASGVRFTPASWKIGASSANENASRCRPSPA
jgi:hypothetical protein